MTTTAPTPAPSSALRTILLLVGSLVLVGIVGVIIVSVVSNANRTDASGEETFDESFDQVTVNVEVSDVVVEYADVDEATVTFDQNDSNRNMDFEAEVNGDELEVRVTDQWAGFWLPFGNTGSPRLTITLPESLEKLDLRVKNDVGDVVVDGEYGELDLSSSVGDIRLEGSAVRADLESSVGDITARDYSVDDELQITSSTGEVTLTLDAVPSTLDVRSSVGDQNITVPDGSYRIETETSVGDVDIRVDNDQDADTYLRLETSVGDITVRS